MEDERAAAQDAAKARVAANVRRLRKKAGLSRDALALAAGNSPKHLGQIERSEVNVTIDVLAGIAVALSVDMTDLFAERLEESGENIRLVRERDLDALERLVQSLRRGALRK